MSATKLKTITESRWFNNAIRIAILLAGICVGLEMEPSITEHWGGPLSLINDLILWIFVLEAGLKLAAEGSKPWNYFRDPWNVFDFTIVAVCFMPFDAQYVAVLRLLRLTDQSHPSRLPQPTSAPRDLTRRGVGGALWSCSGQWCSDRPTLQLHTVTASDVGPGLAVAAEARTGGLSTSSSEWLPLHTPRATAHHQTTASLLSHE